MTWLSPWTAAIAAAVAVPTLLILYFLKLRRRDLEISTTLLWKKAIQDLQANAPFQRLRRNILLFLQLLILAAAIAALGQPQWNASSESGERTVIIIDTSASMQTLDETSRGEARSRLEAAKEQALAVVEALREPSVLDREGGDSAMVIAGGVSAQVRQTFTSDKGKLRAAINAIEPTDTPSGLKEAVRLARAQAPKRLVEGQAVEGLTAAWPLTLHLFSDGRLPDALEAKPGPEDTVVYHRLGQSGTANIGIVSLSAAREYIAPTRLSVYAGLQSTDATPRTAEVELLVDGATLRVSQVNIPAAARQPGEDRARPGVAGVAFEINRQEGALVEVRVRPPSSGGDARPLDDFEADDRGWLVVPPARQLALLAVTEGNYFLGSALKALPLARLTTVSPAQYAAAVAGGQGESFDVVVFDRWLPTLGRGELPPGRSLVLGAVPGALAPDQAKDLAELRPWVVDHGESGASSIVDWVHDHPVMRSVSLDHLIIARGRRVEIPPGSTAMTLATSDQGPAVLDMVGGQSRAIVVPFDVAQSNWPFDVSFVLFLASSIDYLGGAGGVVRSLRPGEILSDRLPAGVAQAELRTPSKVSEQIVPAADGSLVYGPLLNRGLYELSWSGPAAPADAGPARRYASNLLDGAESDVGAAEELNVATQRVVARAQGSSQGQRTLWPYLVLAALLVMMLEWYVYNRRVHI